MTCVKCHQPFSSGQKFHYTRSGAVFHCDCASGGHRNGCRAALAAIKKLESELSRAWERYVWGSP